MQTVDIKKVANGYLVEISGDYDTIDDEVYMYKTREELEADLVTILVRAHQVYLEVIAKKEAKDKKED